MQDWTNKFNTSVISEILTGAHVFFGPGAISKMSVIAAELKKRGLKHVLVMTGRSAYEKSGAWKFVTEAFGKEEIKYLLYNKVTSNPETHQVDEAVKLAKEAGCDCVMGIGGGSPIDAGKSAAILLANPDKNCTQLFKYEFAPEKAVPFIAINMTHGTGSEGNRFAVVSIPEEQLKPAIGYPCIYPLFSIDDPVLMKTLSIPQSIYTSVDAINHVTEASTSIAFNPLAITLGKDVIRLVVEYLPRVMAKPEDLEARYFLAYAALIAGISFDNGGLHYTHALEHPLSAMKPQVTHGHGLGILLPAVLREIYPVTSHILADLYAPIVPGLTGEGTEEETKKIVDGVKAWLKGVTITEGLHDLGFTKEDLDRLTELAFITPSLSNLLGTAPTKATKEVVRRIYEESF